MKQEHGMWYAHKRQEIDEIIKLTLEEDEFENERLNEFIKAQEAIGNDLEVLKSNLNHTNIQQRNIIMSFRRLQAAAVLKIFVKLLLQEFEG